MHGRIGVFAALLLFWVGGSRMPVDGGSNCGAEPFSLEEVAVVCQENQGCPDIPLVVTLEQNAEEAASELSLSEEEVDLIALVTMAEAEGESEYGKRLVIDTILNRVDSPHYPDTVSEVVYQPSQFSCMWNGRVDRCCVMDDICQLVEEEAKERQNCEVVFFRAGRYSKYGVPLFQEGNHYFSSYE